MSAGVLASAIDALAALDDDALASAELVRALAVHAARLDAVMCRQAAAFDRGAVWRQDDAKSSVDWVAGETHADRRASARRLRVGRAMEVCEGAAAAFDAGAITSEHVRVLSEARDRNRTTAQAYARDEAMLVGWATGESFETFRWMVESWVLAVDRHDAERRAQRQLERRRVHLSQSFERQWYLNGELDPVAGDTVHAALERIEHDLFLTEWADAEARLGREPTVHDLARSPAQRRADALVEMAKRANTAPANGRAPKPLVTILAGEAAFAEMCRLASGVPLTPGEAALVLTDADIETIVFDAPDRPISVSRQRSFRGAVRRAIQVRDGHCQGNACHEPAERCEIDHIDPYANGGLTSLDNGRLLCAFHNRARNPHPPSQRRHQRRRRPPDG